jgi:DNA modification methylase
MSRTFLDGKVTLLGGDSREVLATLETASVDSVVCDPPYGLDFMGRAWDSLDGAPFAMEFWREVLRVLKPGGHLVAFSGTRTYHRLACAIEDAGFEIRDQLAWCYSQGFPKSLDVSKAIDKAAGAEREVVGRYQPPNGTTWNLQSDVARSDVGAVGHSSRAASLDITAPTTSAAREWSGWGTALKPSWEPIVLARKPLIGTVAANVLEHGTGALNIDGCRIAGEVPSVPQPAFNSPTGNVYGYKAGEGRNGEMSAAPLGRWPANLLHDGSEEVTERFPDTASGARQNTAINKSDARNVYGEFSGGESSKQYDADSGSAARFFYTAKASADDRLGSKHPTVKPVDLMQWLVRLVTPKGGTVLDPFSGTGTTGEAAWREGCRAILIEREEEYQADIARRMELAQQPTKRAAVAKTKNAIAGHDDLPLFGGLPEAAE